MINRGGYTLCQQLVSLLSPGPAECETQTSVAAHIHTIVAAKVDTGGIKIADIDVGREYIGRDEQCAPDPKVTIDRAAVNIIAIIRVGGFIAGVYDELRFNLVNRVVDTDAPVVDTEGQSGYLLWGQHRTHGETVGFFRLQGRVTTSDSVVLPGGAWRDTAVLCGRHPGVGALGGRSYRGGTRAVLVTTPQLQVQGFKELSEIRYTDCTVITAAYLDTRYGCPFTHELVGVRGDADAVIGIAVTQVQAQGLNPVLVLGDGDLGLQEELADIQAACYCGKTATLAGTVTALVIFIRLEVHLLFAVLTAQDQFDALIRHGELEAVISQVAGDVADDLVLAHLSLLEQGYAQIIDLILGHAAGMPDIPWYAIGITLIDDGVTHNLVERRTGGVGVDDCLQRPVDTGCRQVVVVAFAQQHP